MNSVLKLSFLLLITFNVASAFAADYKNGVNHINQQEMAEKLNDTNTVLIDIRRQDEIDEGYIAGAVHVPIIELMKDISLLDPYLNKDLILYCHVGERVEVLTDYLQDIGHPSKDKLYHLKGDMRAWRARGNKVETKPMPSKLNKK